MKDLVEIPSILCQLWGKVDMKLNCILFFRSSHYERRNIMKLDFVIFFGSNKELVSLSGQLQPNLKVYKSPRAWQQELFLP